MKKKIVSLALALVMVVLALVGCGAPQLDEIDYSNYAEFDYEEFLNKLANIEIEDGAYTNNSVYRDIIVKENVYSSVASAIVKADKKLYSGIIGANDVVYYCYYVTYDGQNFYFDQMDVSSVTASSTSSAHVIQLGAVSKDDEDFDFKSKLLAALSGKDLTNNVYKVNNTKNTVVKLGDDGAVTIVVSYTRSYANDEGDTVKEVVKYEEIVLSEATAANNAFYAALLAEGSVVKVGNKVTVKKTVVDNNGTEDDTTDDTTNTTDVSIFDIEMDGKKYTYENVQVKWIVEEKPNDSFTFTYTPFVSEGEDETKKTEVEPSGIHAENAKVDLTNKELTYHVFPIYSYDVPEFDTDEVIATAIIKYILGSSVKANSLEIFGDESFKLDDTTIKALAEQLVELYSLKSSKKWNEASEKLAAYAYIKVLAKLNGSSFELTDEEKSDDAFKDLVAMFELLDKLSDLSLINDINFNDSSVSMSGLTDEQKATLTAIFDYLAGVTVDVVFDGYFTLSAEDVAAVLKLKALVETELPGKIADKNAEIKAKEDAIADAEAAAEVDADAVAALKTELEAFKKDLSNLKAELTLEATTLKADALKLFSNAKTDAYSNTIDRAIDSKIAEIISCKSDNGTADDDTDDKVAAVEIVAEKYDAVRHDYDSEYRTYVATQVAAEIYVAIDKCVTIIDYPEEILKEFADHIYEEYEYKFYKEKRADGSESNYSYFKGDLEAYLKDALKADDYMAAIKEEAKGYLDPMIKIYTVAKHFDGLGAQETLASFIEMDIAAGVYDAHFNDDDKSTAEEKAEAEKNADENKTAARDDAKYFFINNDAYKVFKDSQGSGYNELVEVYGERNLRAALQFNKLFDYLASTQFEVSKHNGEWHVEALTREVADDNGTPDDTSDDFTRIEIVFHNDLVKYTVK